MATHYSVIRYLPDPIAEEAINVGVVVFGNGIRPMFRFVADWTRARQFGGEKTEFLQRFATQVSSSQLGIFSDAGAWDEDKLRYLLGRWHNSIQFSPPRASLKNPASLLEEVSASFLRSGMRRASRRQTRLNTEVRTLFREMKVLAKTPSDLKKHRVVTDYPIDRKTGLIAEFALKNTVFHVMETIDYRSAEPAATAKFYETGAKALLLSEARERLGDHTKRYVIYSARPEDRSTLKTQLALLGNHADHLINYESRRDLASFGAMVKKAVGMAELPI